MDEGKSINKENNQLYIFTAVNVIIIIIMIIVIIIIIFAQNIVCGYT